MVSQIVWLGVRDVFTQIAKDVVGQGLDHGALTFKAKFAGVIHANMADSRRKRFSALGRRSPRGLLHNSCGVSGGTTAFSDVTEGKEKQKPASRMVLHKASYVKFRKFLRKTWFYERILMAHSFLEQIGQPEVDLATIRRKASLCARCYIYSRDFFITNLLHSDRTWLEFGRYVLTEWHGRSVAT
ncbi:hypothetical protein DY000_02017986 [Brassica cretica]|uniref:Uncharacterized protein n=1 Tax=Brassica cretica TaxID=69181 RepID=A0ABQ7CZH5_BRACR|nr:hypothetical protein DY000_02017986 [Brassica cretica]